jgi:hypothetical protein
MDQEKSTTDQLADLRRHLDLRAAVDARLDDDGKQLLYELMDHGDDMAQRDYRTNFECVVRHFPGFERALRAVYLHVGGQTFAEQTADCCGGEL